MESLLGLWTPSGQILWDYQKGKAEKNRQRDDEKKPLRLTKLFHINNQELVWTPGNMNSRPTLWCLENGLIYYTCVCMHVCMHVCVCASVGENAYAGAGACMTKTVCGEGQRTVQLLDYLLAPWRFNDLTQVIRSAHRELQLPMRLFQNIKMSKGKESWKQEIKNLSYAKDLPVALVAGFLRETLETWKNWVDIFVVKHAFPRNPLSAAVCINSDGGSNTFPHLQRC